MPPHISPGCIFLHVAKRSGCIGHICFEIGSVAIQPMESDSETYSPVYKMHSGWRRHLRQAAFAVSAVKYLQKHKYPLFSIGGALSTYRIMRELKLHKLIQLDDRFFTTPVLPCYPSPAFDHMVGTGGLNINKTGTPLKQQISMILLGITRKCKLRCLHCYERFNIGSDEAVSIDRWKEVIREIQSIDAGVIVLTGGEPMQRNDELLELLRSADRGSIGIPSSYFRPGRNTRTRSGNAPRGTHCGGGRP